MYGRINLLFSIIVILTDKNQHNLFNMLVFLEYSIDMFLLLVSEFRFSCNIILGILKVCTLNFYFTKYCAVIYDLFFIFHSLFYVL